MTQSTSNAPTTGAPVPTWLLGAPTTSGAIRVYATLSLHADEDGEITLTKSQLAHLVGKSISTVYRLARELESLGAIDAAPVIENRCHVATTYTLPHPGGNVPIPTEPMPVREKYGAPRRKISAAKRLAVYERDGFQCVSCGTNKDLTLDHIIPWSKGGSDDIENLQTMCRSENSKKGAK